MKRRHVKQSVLARRIGFSQPTISALTDGSIADPGVRLVVGIAAFFRVSVAYLVGLTEKPKSGYIPSSGFAEDEYPLDGDVPTLLASIATEARRTAEALRAAQRVASRELVTLNKRVASLERTRQQYARR
jgi:transcriptional regulator with XRE-family HTH domain